MLLLMRFLAPGNRLTGAETLKSMEKPSKAELEETIRKLHEKLTPVFGLVSGLDVKRHHAERHELVVKGINDVWWTLEKTCGRIFKRGAVKNQP